MMLPTGRPPDKEVGETAWRVRARKPISRHFGTAIDRSSHSNRQLPRLTGGAKRQEETFVLEIYYSWYSICSEKVLICLFEKNLSFEGHHVDLFDFAQVQDNYLAVNPDGVVPTLIDDGRPVYESTVINEYLEDVAPQPALRPVDAYTCANMRRWVQLFQDIVFPSAGLLSQIAFIAEELNRRWATDELEELIHRKVNKDRVPRQLRAVRGDLTNDEAETALAKIGDVLDRAEQAFGDGRDWIAGDFSLADAAAAPNLYRLEIIERLDLIECRPAVSAWYQRLKARPAFRRTYEFSPSIII
jgi:glutathione S-transferase